MEFHTLFKRVIGIDVHQAKLVACAILEDDSGNFSIERREFGGLQRDQKALAQWALALAPDQIMMESTGVYWKSLYTQLELAGLPVIVANAKHVKNVPGRKTDMSDAEWLAMLARAGLVRASFVPPILLRQLRLISRQRQALSSELAGSKNRVHKVVTDSGIRLGTMISDIHGKSGRAMIKALIAGKPTHEVLDQAKRLRASREDLFEAIQGQLSEAHRFVLAEQIAHIEQLEASIARYDAYLLGQLAHEKETLARLQTIPGVDLIGAAMLIVEIGTDMSVFGGADRLASWAGVCPGNHESAGKRKSGRTSKGNPYARRLLVEMAQAARRTQCLMKAKFESLVGRRGHKRSIIAIGHKILRVIFYMISRGTFYQDTAANYEALCTKRQAPRWIKQLKKHGLLPA